MTAREEAVLSMFRSTQQHCTNNNAIISTNAAFMASFNSFNAQLSTLISTETKAQKKTKGVAKDKETLRAELVQAAYDLAAQIFAYANKQKNQTLKKQVDFSITDLERIKDELLVPTCNNIKTQASSNLTALTDYQVTAATLTAFQKSIDDYSAAVPTPRLAIAAKTADNKLVKATIKEISSILKNEMDKTVVAFRKAPPSFVTEYFEARKIIDPASKPKAKPKKEEGATK
jgi:hypothetical protein